MLITEMLFAAMLFKTAAPFIRQIAACNDLRRKPVGPLVITKQEAVKGYWLPEELPALEQGDLEVLKLGEERHQVIERAKKWWPSKN